MSKTRLPIAQPLLPRPRASESLEDGRRWSDHFAEFATGIVMYRVDPAEIDVLELGVRAAVGYCKEFTEAWERGAMWREMRLLHPTEYPKGLI